MSIGSLQPTPAVRQKLTDRGIRHIARAPERHLSPWNRFGPFGFGQTFPGALVQPLASALAVRVWPGVWNYVNPAAQSWAVQSWLASVRGSCVKANLNPFNLDLAEFETCAQQIKPAWAYQEMTIVNIGFRLPEFQPTYCQSLPVVLRWEHYAFAHGLFAHLVRYLDTEELMQPELVWRLLHEHFRMYISAQVGQTWKNLPPGDQRRHLISLRLAMYERLLHLWNEIRDPDQEWQQALGPRPSVVRYSAWRGSGPAPDPLNRWEAMLDLLQFFLLYTKLTLRGLTAR